MFINARTRMGIAVVCVIAGAGTMSTGCADIVTKPPQCATDTDCKNEGIYKYCDKVQGKCVATLDGGVDLRTDMPVNMPDLIVDLAQPDLWKCAESSQCTDEMKSLCDPDTKACRACAGPSDDSLCKTRSATTPACLNGRCVACREMDVEDANCGGGAKPVCDAKAHGCRECAKNAECKSELCLVDGKCAGEAEVLYVDNANGTCSGTRDGTKAKPYCDIKAALMNLGAKAYVKVASSTAAYGAIDTPGGSGSVTIVSSGFESGTQLPKVPSISVTDKWTVGIYGFDVSIATSPAVTCTGKMASLTLVRSFVHDSDLGVQVADCKLTLEANRILLNKNGGVKLNNAVSYSITNNIIGSNGVAGRAVSFDDLATGIFRFNTVAFNTFTGQAGAFTCGTANDKLIEHSIVFGNSQRSGTQFAGNCKLSNVVTGVDLFAGATQLPPAFIDDAGDYHLKKTDALNTACCVNKVAPTTPNLPPRDVDWLARPIGAAWDIGADEVE